MVRYVEAMGSIMLIMQHDIFNSKLQGAYLVPLILIFNIPGSSFTLNRYIIDISWLITNNCMIILNKNNFLKLPDAHSIHSLYSLTLFNHSIHSLFFRKYWRTSRELALTNVCFVATGANH